MRISVIVATFNRASLLEECLDHLARQPFRDGDEVIVADNGSTDDTAIVVARQARTFPVPLLRVEERRPGKSNALARGIAEASGDIYAFTDDDVNVGEGWLAALREAMADDSVALAGGRVAARWERTPPGWLAEAGRPGRLAAPLALTDYGPAVIEFGPRTAMGGNMAIRRDVIERVGGFAPHLGSLRGTLLTGEDQELCRRVQAAGLRALYVPSAIVHHWVPAQRMRLAYFFRWFYWSGIANAAIDAADAAAVRTIADVPRYLIKRAAAGVLRAPWLALSGRRDRAAEAVMDVAFAAGYAAQRWGLVPSLRQPAVRAKEGAA